ncbi:hypothetical protein HHI36_017314, partial [Cryptolaemus montrouzieri]
MDRGLDRQSAYSFRNIGIGVLSSPEPLDGSIEPSSRILSTYCYINPHCSHKYESEAQRHSSANKLAISSGDDASLSSRNISLG